MAVNPYASPNSPGAPPVRPRSRSWVRLICLELLFFVALPMAIEYGIFAYLDRPPPAAAAVEQSLERLNRVFAITKYSILTTKVIQILGVGVFSATFVAWHRERKGRVRDAAEGACGKDLG